MVIISLPITKEQFEGSLPDFINTYKRLPYIHDDDVSVEIKNDKGELELRPYRANRYIREYYGGQDKMTEELLEREIITYKSIADTLNLTETLVRNAIEKSTQNPQLHVRRGLDIYFNRDLYKKELGDYNDRCQNSCSRRCKQFYYMDTGACSRYKQKSSK